MIRCSGLALLDPWSGQYKRCEATTEPHGPDAKRGWRFERFGAFCPDHAPTTRRGRAA